jgi:predicted transcriptional regulator
MFKLTNRQLDVLVALLELDINFKQLLPTDVKHILSTSSKKYIMKSTGLNKNNLCKYVNTIISKGVIKFDSNRNASVTKMYIPTIFEDSISVKYNIVCHQS